MIRYDVDFVIGASWPERGPLLVSYLLSDGATSGIPAGYLARAQWRPHPNSTTLLLEKTPSIDYDAGSFEIFLEAEDTAGLGSLSRWGLQLESPDGHVKVPLAKGEWNGSLNTVRA